MCKDALISTVVATLIGFTGCVETPRVNLDNESRIRMRVITAAHVVVGDPQPQVEFFTKRNAPVRLRYFLGLKVVAMKYEA